MGARSSRIGHNQWDMNELARATGLQFQQVQSIYQDFKEAAGQDGQLNMNEFARFYNRFPGAQQQDQRYMQQQIPRLFRTFDQDNSGALSFDEFLSAVVMMNHDMPRKERIDFLVRQNNGQGRQHDGGRISSQYGHQVFRRLNDYYGLPAGSEHQCWQQVDRNNRGYVTQEELINYITQQQGYNQHYQC
jgi:Ca2+-binding EF-hand superfamily protein